MGKSQNSKPDKASWIIQSRNENLAFKKKNERDRQTASLRVFIISIKLITNILLEK